MGNVFLMYTRSPTLNLSGEFVTFCSLSDISLLMNIFFLFSARAYHGFEVNETFFLSLVFMYGQKEFSERS